MLGIQPLAHKILCDYDANANADANGLRTKNNMPPPSPRTLPIGGGHKYSVQVTDKTVRLWTLIYILHYSHFTLFNITCASVLYLTLSPFWSELFHPWHWTEPLFQTGV